MELAVIDLDELSRAASTLEPLPTSVLRLARLVAGTPDLADIVEVVEYDQAMTAVLLRAANSSWSASRTEITTVKHAVVRLGAGPVLSLALGVNVKARLNIAVPAYGLAEGDLWRHSVAASIAAEILAKFADRRPPAETPTAALLHDIGKLVIARFVEPSDLALVVQAESDGAPRTQAERDVLGIDHAHLGAVIAQSWNLPRVLVDGIASHHAPVLAHTPIAYSVHLADVLAKAAGYGTDDNTDFETFTKAIAALGLTIDNCDEVCRLVMERFDEVSARYA